MDVTKMITKILTEYQNTDMRINSALKYQFTYNGYKSDIFYTTKDGLQNQLLLSILIDSTAYLTTLNFSKRDSKYYMMSYLPPELYKEVQFKLLLVDNHCSTTPYFKKMQEDILLHKPILVNHREELYKKSYYCYKTEQDKPYFKTTKRAKMSDYMKNKILSKYENNLANKILSFCGITQTLVFTDDIKQSKDIEAYIKDYSK